MNTTETFRSQTWVDIPEDKSISALTLLENVSNTPPDKVVLEEAATGNYITYAQLRQYVRRLAHWMVNHMGLQAGQRVSVMLPSSIGNILAIHACWWAGGIVNTINHVSSDSEITNAIELVRPDFLIFSEQSMKAIERLQGQSITTPKPHFVYSGDGDVHYLTVPILSGYENQMPMAPLLRPRSSEVCALITLSSGTTGSPKAVMLSHFNLVASCLQLRGHNEQNWRGSQSEIFFPPLSHIYGIYVCVTMSTWIGAYVCLMPRFDIESYCRLLHDKKATVARIVPTIAKVLAEDPAVLRYEYPHLEYFSCSAAPITEKTAEKLNKRFSRVRLCQTYGCTELSGAVAQSGIQDENLPLIAGGQPIANVEIKCLAQDGTFTSIGNVGEIVIKSPGMMMGYITPEGLAAPETPNEGYHTGDVGYVDDNGYIIITDRLKDMIKYKGFQVGPGELEKLVLEHDEVQEVAVCGVWNDQMDTEEPTAFVVLREKSKDTQNRSIIAKSIISTIESRVANYKRLRGGVVFLNSLPKNSLGKVLKRVLTRSKLDSMKLTAKL